MNYKHSVPAQLRFSDVDRFSHVNNSVYFSLFDMAKTQYFRDVFQMEVFDDIAMVVGSLEANFLSPILFTEEIDIQTSIVRLGNKSFTLNQRAINSRTQEVKCECKTNMVMFDTIHKTTTPIPDIYRKRAKDFEGENLL